MDEHFATQQAKAARSLYVVDGNAFNGDYTNWRLPIPRSMASYEFDGLNPNADKPVSDYAEDIKPQFSDPLLSSIYDLMSEPDAPRYVDPTEAMIELYDEVGDNEYYETTSGKVVKKDYLKDVDIVTSAETKRNREMLHTALSQPTEFPSYLDPTNPAHRTGRGRELQRRKDCGRLQRLRWNMDIDPADDILRGHRETGNAITKEFLDSVEWEQPMPTYHDRNFYKRTFAEGGFGEADRTSDSYFDIQFIGSPDTYPFAISAGMQYTWPIYWVPLLTKKHPKRYGQPLRSPVFNLGGIEPLQLWFYPEGSASSTDGFCSLKLVAPPGWCLPYRIYMFVFSEYNRTVVGPMYRESKDYISRSLNFCRLVDKSDKEFLRMRENDKDYVILGPAGNVYVGVGVVDEPLRTAPGSHRFAYDWDEGDYDLHQWLKKQTADPDDAFQQDNVDRERTHSIWYESHKYKRTRSSFDDFSYNNIAFLGSAAITLCRSWDSYSSRDNEDDYSDRRYDNTSNAVPRFQDDHYVSVDIPIDFGPGDTGHPGSYTAPSGSTTPTGWWDRLKPPPAFNGSFSSRDAGSFGSWPLMGLVSSMNNVSPTGFGNFFMLCCGSVFGLWFMSDRLRDPWLSRLLQNHFLASRNSLEVRRWHTLLTSSISHSSFLHLFLNCMMFHQLINTFARQMSPPGSPRHAVSSIDRLFSSMTSGIENFFWPDKRYRHRTNTVQTSDIMGVMLLSGLCSSLGHVYLYRTPVFGASGAISGLLYLLASTFPNSYFRTVFPIPGLQVSILQVCQVFVATNLYFLFFGSKLRNIAWAAHLFGFGSAAVYCYVQQKVFKRPGFRNPITLSLRTAKRQWLRTFKVAISHNLHTKMVVIAALLRGVAFAALYSANIVGCVEEYFIFDSISDSNVIPESLIHENYNVPISFHSGLSNVDSILAVESTACTSPVSTDTDTITRWYCPYRLTTNEKDSFDSTVSSRDLVARRNDPVGFIRSYGSTLGENHNAGHDGNRISNFGLFGGGGNNSGSGSLDELIEANKTSGGVLLVDFYATWCRPCDVMSANLRIIESRYKPGKLVIHKIDVDENTELCTSYEITALPTILLFSRGKLVKRVRGVIDVTSLMDMINEALDNTS
ncbi:hypothetical protein BaOVIS_032870 [Babesia ovis]|uniref:Thioredoxin domain-containing protein n=1 Tax=Babesia ovis TaxID=5869 RepID=A0A9W5TDJ3_BABOV|nr:hypothetical protein BaOVIS_032870 [Babesia ovis]